MYNTKFYFAILSDGKEKRVANWSNADAMLLVETLRRERGDLLAVVKDACMALAPGQSSGNEVLADVSLVDYHQAPVTNPSESVKHGNPSFRSTLEAGELELLADMCNELEIFAYPHPVTADHLAATNQIHGIKNDNRINCIEKTIQKMYSCRKNSQKHWHVSIHFCNVMKNVYLCTRKSK